MTVLAPELINPLELPSLPLEWRRGLPKCRACYLAIKSNGEVLYVGQTQNLQKRWKSHHFLKTLDLAGTRIAWLEVSDESLLPAIEAALIEYFHPPLNKRPGNPYYHKKEKSDREVFCRLRILMADRAKPLNQRQVALATGLSATTINQLCRNNFSLIDVETIKKICTYFKCEVGDLLVIRKVKHNNEDGAGDTP